MALFSFNTPKPKRFEYRPLYYNERKERLEKMKAAAEAEISGKSSYETLQKGFLSKKLQKPKTLLEKGFSFLRIVTIILLVVLFYVLAQEIYLLFHLLAK
jgi:hypothetical protein